MRRTLTVSILLAVMVVPLLFSFDAKVFAEAPGKDDAKGLVKEAVSFFTANGREKFLAAVNSPKGAFHFAEGQKKGMYIFVYDEKGVVVAHGARVELVGRNRWNDKDPDGKPWIQDWTKLVHEKGSGWIDYKEFNPAAGNKLMNKSSFVELKDGLIIGCGIYQ